MRSFAIVFMLFALAFSGCSIKEKLSDRFLQPYPGFIATPDDVGYEYEEIGVVSKDNRRIHGWLIHPKSTPKGTVIICHGNTGNISYFGPYYSFLADNGYYVLLYDYQGFGDSSGKPDVDELFLDFQYLFPWLKARFPEGSPERERLAVFGISLGTMVAMEAAANFPEIKAIVLEDVVSARDNIDRFLREQGFGCFTRGAAMTYLNMFVLPGGIEPDDNAGKTDAPILILHGAEDRIFNLDASIRTYRSARPRSELWVMPDSGHAPEPTRDYDGEYQQGIVGFLDAALEGDWHPIEVTWEVDEGNDLVVSVQSSSKNFPQAIQITLLSGGKLLAHRNVLMSADNMKLRFSKVGEVDAVAAHELVNVVMSVDSWSRVESDYALSCDIAEKVQERVSALESLTLERIVGDAPSMDIGPPESRLADPEELNACLKEVERELGKHEGLHPTAEAELASTWAYLGMQWYWHGDLDRAFPWLVRSVDAIPAQPNLHFWMGNGRFHAGFYLGELQERAALALHDHYLKKERFADALRVAESVLRVEPAKREWLKRKRELQSKLKD